MAQPTQDLTGRVFGRLTVISRAPRPAHTKPTYGACWLCKCSCGNEKVISSSNLRSGRATSCRCYHRELLSKPPGVAAFNAVLSTTRAAARRRNLEWSLTDEQLHELLKSNCHYCGSSPENGGYKSKRTRMLHNGIDRVNNKIGYTIDNSVSCCHTCNRAKSNMSVEDFHNWIARLVMYTMQQVHNSV